MQNKRLVIDSQPPVRSTPELSIGEQKAGGRLEGTRADNDHCASTARVFFSLGCDLKIHGRGT